MNTKEIIRMIDNILEQEDECWTFTGSSKVMLVGLYQLRKYLEEQQTRRKK